MTGEPIVPEERRGVAWQLPDTVGGILFAIDEGIRRLRAEHAHDAELGARLEVLAWQATVAAALFRTSGAPGRTAGQPRKSIDTNGFGLTRREYEILLHISLGLRNVEIAQALGLAPNTVKTYLQNALSKLGARNRIEAINRLHDHGLL